MTRHSARLAAARMAYALCTRVTVRAWAASISLAAWIQRQAEQHATEAGEVSGLIADLEGMNARGSARGDRPS